MKIEEPFINLDERDVTDSTEVRALREATTRLIELLAETGLLPRKALESLWGWNLVSWPNEKCLLLSVEWDK